MSFSIRSGKVWETNETITAQKLNDMLGEATAFGLVTSDLETGYRLYDVATSQPTPTLGYPWIDSEDGYIRLGDGTRFTYDSGVVFFQNNLGSQLNKGKAVQVDFASSADRVTFGAGLGNRNKVLGVCLQDTAAGSFAPIMYRGIAQVNIVNVDESSSTWPGPRNGYFVALETLSGSTGDSMAFAPDEMVLADGSMMWFAHLLENPGSVGDAWTPTLYWCKIHK